jgi:copper chaperone CopZ
MASENLHRGLAHGLGQGDGPGVYVSFSVMGMTCMSCARKVEGVLWERPGVIEAVVDLAGQEATVSYDPEKVSPDDLKAAVETVGYRVLENQTNDLEDTNSPPLTHVLLSRPRPYLIGAVAALGVVGFYLGLITLTSDWYNAWMQFSEYRWWILALSTGLGVQAALYSLLRSRLKGGTMKAAKSSLAASGGTSTVAMAACCAHYIVAFLPALGLPFLSAAAASLDRYQTYFFLVGVLSNLFGIGLMLRMMEKNGMIPAEALLSRLTFGLRRVGQ